MAYPREEDQSEEVKLFLSPNEQLYYGEIFRNYADPEQKVLYKSAAQILMRKTGLEFAQLFAIWNSVALKKASLDIESFNRLLKLIAILQKFGSFTKATKLMKCEVPLPYFDDDKLIALRQKYDIEAYRVPGSCCVKEQAMKIAITEIQSVSQGLMGWKSFNRYKIETQVRKRQNQMSASGDYYSMEDASIYSVYRRYKDFVWLDQKLKERAPGSAIPPLPEKKYIGNMGEEFVTKRKEELQNYLNLVSSHEELRSSPALVQFLTENDQNFEQLKKMNQQTWREYLMTPLSKIKEIGVVNSAQNLVTHWQVKEEPEELKGSIDLEDLKNQLLKYIPELKQTDWALGQLYSQRAEKRKLMNSFFDELDKLNIETQEAHGSQMARQYTELLQNADLSYGQLKRCLKQEILKLQAIQEAVKRREEKVHQYLQKQRLLTQKKEALNTYHQNGNMVFKLNQQINDVNQDLSQLKIHVLKINQSLKKDHQSSEKRRIVLFQQAFVLLAQTQTQKIQKVEKFWESFSRRSVRFGSSYSRGLNM